MNRRQLAKGEKTLQRLIIIALISIIFGEFVLFMDRLIPPPIVQYVSFTFILILVIDRLWNDEI